MRFGKLCPVELLGKKSSTRLCSFDGMTLANFRPDCSVVEQENGVAVSGSELRRIGAGAGNRLA